MSEKIRSPLTIAINFSSLFSRLTSRQSRLSLILSILLILQIVLLYGITRYGYLENKLPYWFDNFVQKYGVWQIYGKKELPTETTNVLLPLDLRLDIVKEARFMIPLKGMLTNVSSNDSGVTDWTIEFPDGTSFRVEDIARIESILKRDCTDPSTSCVNVGFASVSDKGVLDDISMVGNFVLVNLEYKYDKSNNSWRYTPKTTYITQY